jgi:hypothetical protein
MKKAVFYCLLLLLALPVWTQNVVSGVSGSSYINISKDPPKPPYLEIPSGSIQFTDPGGNKIIDAGEKAYIRFDLKNSGMGPGLNLQAMVRQIGDTKGLTYSRSLNLGTLEPGKSKRVEIPLTGGMDLVGGEAEFEVFVNEANGFDSDPFSIVIPTAAFRAPLVKIVDHKLSSQSGTTLEKRRPFELQLLLQNVGQGQADNVRVALPVPQDIFCLSGNEDAFVGTLAVGETYLIDYSFVTTAAYNRENITFTFRPTEKHGKYSESKTITLSMNQQVSDQRLVVEGKKESRTEVLTASLTSAVDKNIPANPSKKANRIALVIGNENYAGGGSLNAQINVDYARNDAVIFREYALKTLGVKEDNMFFLTDASAGAMKREIDRVTELLKRLGPESELIFYYAGHGLPDEATGIPYLIPVDVDATNLSYAVRLSEVYRKFSETGAKRITILLDACFSGGARNQPLLAARGVRIKPESEPISGNMVVFAASSGDQSSLPYHREKHGLFTYFLLKKLQETGGEVNYGQLTDYLKREVGIVSLRENGKEQDPEIRVSHEIENNWREGKVK